MRRLALILVGAVLLMGAAPAPAPDVPLADVAAEARARALFADIRCVVCQHESVADSPAGVAADLRRLVREEIAAGATDQEIREGLVRRYGDYILFTPPFRASTLLLWLAPLLILVGAAGLFVGVARRRRAEPAPLSPAEEAALEQRLADRPDLDV
jgi:cytochrome c-type biogenesis protein CcmH